MSGELPLDEPVHLCVYDTIWPEQFATEAARISVILPADVAIEHIGSTSVPGLLAKPIIDIMAGLEPWHESLGVRSALVDLGYEDMGEAGVPGRIYLRRRDAVFFNIALVARGGSIWTANLALRDYLRENSDAAREYAAVKRAAVESGRRYLLAYSEYKGVVLNRLIRQARNH